MKSFLKILSKLILILSILAISSLIILDLYIIIKILFFGMSVGSDLPNTIWFSKDFLIGFKGLIKYYNALGRGILVIFELPVTLICVIYQLIYFKIIKKKL